MKNIDTVEIYAAVKRLALRCVCETDEATGRAISEAYERETVPTAKFALGLLTENYEIAKRERMPLCQDTGMAVVFIELGQSVLLTGEPLEDAVNRAVGEVYRDSRYRLGTVDPITRVNCGSNIPAVVYTELVPGESVKVSFMAKGFGSENMSRLFMLKPCDGIEGIKKCVVETVTDAGGKACPPLTVGVGIGGTADKAMFMAKKALFRGTDSRNSDETIARIEDELMLLLKHTGVGALGLGGEATALRVNILTYPTHIAALPVAVNLQCHAVRHGSEIIGG